MRMLVDYHKFQYPVSVPWPVEHDVVQIDWINSISTIESWLNTNIGCHYTHWAWNQADHPMWISVAFKEHPHSTIFLLKWA